MKVEQSSTPIPPSPPSSPRRRPEAICCAETTLYKVAFFVGGIFLILGIVALLSQTLNIHDGFFAEVSYITEEAASFIGTSPLNLTIYTVALNGTLFIVGMFGYFFHKKEKP